MCEKLDSAASQNFYGDRDRLIIVSDDTDPIYIEGFTGSKAASTEHGINQDGKHAYFVKGMPEHLALLSAYLYAQDGAVLLFPNDGVVVKMNQDEVGTLKKFVESFPEVFKLKVVNNTYESKWLEKNQNFIFHLEAFLAEDIVPEEAFC
jgi:hypothetical protein